MSRFPPSAAGLVLPAVLVLAVSTSATSAAVTPAQRVPAVPLVRSPAEPGLSLGLTGAENLLSTGSHASITSWNLKAHKAGTQFVRLTVYWSAIAPATPPAGFDASSPTSAGYSWSALDGQVRLLSAEGFKILMEVQSAPTWAEGAGMPASATPGSWEPNATDFGQFETALATRYGGHTADPLLAGRRLPRVSYWQAWEEPNLPAYLAPQWVSTASGYTAESPVYYRNLENAFYTAAHAVSSSNFVVAADTGPYGDAPGGARVSPVTFDQDLLCLTATDTRAKTCGGVTYMDAIDDHPYVAGLCCEAPTVHAANAADTSVPDVYKVVDALKAAERARTVAPAGTKPVWVTEIGWNTSPPNPDHGAASPAATVGHWATQSLYILWSQGVSTVFWYQLADDLESPAGWDSTLTEGLYYRSGAAKPAAAAFAFPFLTVRRSKHTLLAWGRAPKAGTLYVQQRRGGRWTSVLRVKVKADQVFEVPVSLTGSSSFRAVVGAMISPAWSQAG